VSDFDWEAPDASLVSRITAAIKRKKRVENEREKQRHDCPKCHPTAKAMERVRDQWTVAGIDP
jgi:ribosomal protein L37AE/L43A